MKGTGASHISSSGEATVEAVEVPLADQNYVKK